MRRAYMKRHNHSKSTVRIRWVEPGVLRTCATRNSSMACKQFCGETSSTDSNGPTPGRVVSREIFTNSRIETYGIEGFDGFLIFCACRGGFRWGFLSRVMLSLEVFRAWVSFGCRLKVAQLRCDENCRISFLERLWFFSDRLGNFRFIMTVVKAYTGSLGGFVALLFGLFIISTADGMFEFDNCNACDILFYIKKNLIIFLFLLTVFKIIVFMNFKSIFQYNLFIC